MAAPSTTRTARSTQHHPTPDSVPLALWPVAQVSAQYPRAGHYDAGCSEHPAKMIPELVDLPAPLVRVNEEADLVLFERNLTLLAGLPDDHLVSRTSFFALGHAGRARARGPLRSVVAHEDLLVLRRLHSGPGAPGRPR